MTSLESFLNYCCTIVLDESSQCYSEGASAEQRGGSTPCLIPRSLSEKTSEPIIEKEKPVPKPKWVREVPWTPAWIHQWTTYDAEAAVKVLEGWVHAKRQADATLASAQYIASMSRDEATIYLSELKSRPRYIRGRKGNQIDVPMIVTTLDSSESFSVKALLDSGCTGSSIDQTFVQEHGIATIKLPVPIPVYNADGSHNAGGPITECVELRVKIQDHVEKLSFAVTNLGKTPIFLGYEWLELHNPSINWKDRTLQFDRCPAACDYVQRLIGIEDDEHETPDDPEAHLEEGEQIFVFDWQRYIATGGAHIRAKTNVAMDLAIEENAKKVKKSFEELAPEHYHEYKDVFAKENFDSLPERRPWDHAIELTPGAMPVGGKSYPHTLDEQKALDDFLEENLRSGRIRPSKSPWAAPFFFVKKKDGSLRPVQDY